MLVYQSLQALGKADKAQRKSTMLQNILNAIIRTDGIRINPYALSHKEWVITSALGALYLEAMQQLTESQLYNIVKIFIELLHIAL